MRTKQGFLILVLFLVIIFQFWLIEYYKGQRGDAEARLDSLIDFCTPLTKT